MKTAEADLDTSGTQGAGHVHSAWVLIRLHTDKGHEALDAREPADDFLEVDAGVGFVHRGDLQINVVAEYPGVAAIERKAVYDRQAIRGDGGAKPLDDVAIVTVMRRFDENQVEALGRHQPF